MGALTGTPSPCLSSAWPCTPLNEHMEINTPLCLLVPIPDPQWRTRGWTFLQQSVISCPRVPRTSSPAPSAPVAWIAPANGKAAPPTTSKALRLVLWLNRGQFVGMEHLGASCRFSWKKGPSLWKGMGMNDVAPGGHAVGFYFLSPGSKWGEPPALLRHPPFLSPDCSISKGREEP